MYDAEQEYFDSVYERTEHEYAYMGMMRELQLRGYDQVYPVVMPDDRAAWCHVRGEDWGRDCPF